MKQHQDSVFMATVSGEEEGKRRGREGREVVGGSRQGASAIGLRRELGCE